MWLRSPAWDAFWMLSGAWFLLPVLIGGPLKSRLALAFTAAFWISHRLGSLYLAFCRPEYRPLLSSRRGRFLSAPAALAAGVFLFLLAPLPLLPLHRVLLLAGLDLLWEFWHFTAQHYGVASLYRLRAGQDPRGPGKTFERLFCLGVGGAALLAAGAFHAGVALRPDLPWTWLRWGGSAAVLAALAALCAVELRDGNPSLPKLLYLASVAAPPLAAFHMASFRPIFILVPVQHWLAALGLTLHMVKPASAPTPWYRLWSWFDRPWRLLLLAVPVSAALDPLMRAAAHEKQAVLDAVFRLSFILTDAAFPPPLLLLLGLGFSTSFAHYWMDRALFRLCDPEIRAKTLPLVLDPRY